MTVGEWIRSARVRLAAFDAPALEAEILAAHVLRVDRSWLYAHPEAEFPELAGENLLQRREANVPLAYILGFREFFGRRFSVDHRVLIPRQETEILVEAALERRSTSSESVLDLATGSGCIGITLKLERPEWAVTLSDISDEALEVASRNADDLNADVRQVRSDGFANFLGESFDVIVTNPPYIAETESLPDEVLNEPHLALFSGPRGTEFYEMLATCAANHLNDDGMLLMEIGYRQAERVQALFAENGWSSIEVLQDLDRNDRVIVAQFEHECRPSNATC